jgi:hypothetical protein
MACPKKLLLSIFIFTACSVTRAQSDIKAMLKQIAKLENYIIDLEKGYKIAREGLATIGEIKNGEFNLHSLFFSSLKTVSPAIARYLKIAEIISYEVSIGQQFKNLLKAHAGFSPSEIAYIQQVYDHLTNECSKNLDALMEVLTDGKLEMTDDERIKRIDRLYRDTKEKYAFTLSFTQKANSLDLERKNQMQEMEMIKILE